MDGRFNHFEYVLLGTSWSKCWLAVEHVSQHDSQRWTTRSHNLTSHWKSSSATGPFLPSFNLNHISCIQSDSQILNQLCVKRKQHVVPYLVSGKTTNASLHHQHARLVWQGAVWSTWRPRSKKSKRCKLSWGNTWLHWTQKNKTLNTQD